jgi:proteasome lid subunit RPN8/RPN11
MEPFRPKSKSYPNLLERPRPASDKSFKRYGADRDGFEVYINTQVLEELLRETRDAAANGENETIGLLAGRVCHDATGHYTLVQAAAGANEDEIDASPGHVSISGEGNARVRRRLEANHPTLEMVGWYHSHPTQAAQFSREDSREQATWSDSNHIGIVVSGRDDIEPFGVYRGPRATRLDRRKEAIRRQLSGEQARDTTALHRPEPVKAPPNVSHAQATPVASSFVPKRAAESQTVNPAKDIKYLLPASAIIFTCMILGVIWLNYRLHTTEQRLMDKLGNMSNSLEAAVNEPRPTSPTIESDAVSPGDQQSNTKKTESPQAASASQPPARSGGRRSRNVRSVESKRSGKKPVSPTPKKTPTLEPKQNDPAKKPPGTNPDKPKAKE